MAAVICINRLPPPLRMSSPRLRVNQIRRCEPEVPSQDVASQQHVTQINIENIDEFLVEGINNGMIVRDDRVNVYFDIPSCPCFWVLGKVRSLK